jgi:predicted ribosome quality control (RQC) complex YloA/Tae2 family protein
LKKSRAPDLTDERIQVVIDTLDDWKGKLTWNLLLKAVEEKTGIAYSRFTFAEYPTIANAFALRKKALSGTWKAERSQPRDAQVRAALEQVARYRAKVERLESENQLLLEQFFTWATNAERKGVTMAMLNAPLPKPNRDRSKGVE